MRRNRILILPLVLLLVSCQDQDLETVAKSLQTTSQALGTLQQSVLLANTSTPKLISDNSTRKILTVVIEVNRAGLTASQATRNITKLAPQDRASLLNILDPVIDTVSKTLTEAGGLEIQDAKTRDAIRASLLLIQTSLNTAKLALAAR